MKEYLAVNIEVVLFEAQDVLTASGGTMGDKEDGNDVMGDDPYGGF